MSPFKTEDPFEVHEKIGFTCALDVVDAFPDGVSYESISILRNIRKSLKQNGTGFVNRALKRAKLHLKVIYQ